MQTENTKCMLKALDLLEMSLAGKLWPHTEMEDGRQPSATAEHLPNMLALGAATR